MTEPKYDEDVVNLGYLKKSISDTEDNINKEYGNVSRHYSSRPTPPYKKGDTWIDGSTIYTCINSKAIGFYDDNDWTTESGAKAEAERKNKIFLTIPSNYAVGDMWILQSDEDHRAGKRGEILISTAGRSEYEEDDWINMLGYGTIASINEVLSDLNDAIERIGTVEEAIQDGLITTYYQNTIPTKECIGDLWYVTDTTGAYIKGKIYRYDGTVWQLLDDPKIQQAFNEANNARLIADGKIQSFYSETEPTSNMGVGDLWINIADNNKLHRYNGTNWIAVYDPRVDTIETGLQIITERIVEISTDLGQITQTVAETATNIESVNSNIENMQSDLDGLSNDTRLLIEQFASELEQYRVTVSTQFQQTETDYNFLFNKLVEDLNSSTSETNERISEFVSYVRLVDGNIVLGKSDSQLTLRIQNNRISFLQNENEVAYISESTLFITRAQFTESLGVGNFAFIPRANGNLSFKKVGGN